MVQEQKATPPKRSVISLTSIGDVKYWVDKFGVNAAQLREAVARAGTNPDLVDRILRG